MKTANDLSDEDLVRVLRCSFCIGEDEICATCDECHMYDACDGIKLLAEAADRIELLSRRLDRVAGMAFKAEEGRRKAENVIHEVLGLPEAPVC